MIRSMTGFGRAQEHVAGMDVTVEIRSVNHRYFECATRLPRAYGFLDEKLKNFLQTKVTRGKVDVSVYIDLTDVPGTEVVVNKALAEAYLKAGVELENAFGLKNDMTVRSVAQYPDVLTVRRAAEDEEAVWAAVRTVAEEALIRFVEMREREGAKLREDILTRRETLLSAVAFVEERSPALVREYMDKLEGRMRDLLDGTAVDESRLLTEAGLIADKLAVAEETVRLRSHLEQLEQLVNSNEPVGRKLDFLVQEINREVNTTGSKIQDLQVTRVVVDMKSEIEKIREQIQNIE
ncbi:MAG: YicC family protein [Ruminococcaceae bacterium]|nr:YicC family protein [Oscillospiraceae bacterium]